MTQLLLQHVLVLQSMQPLLEQLTSDSVELPALTLVSQPQLLFQLSLQLVIFLNSHDVKCQLRLISREDLVYLVCLKLIMFVPRQVKLAKQQQLGQPLW